jgi:hypothetical protein
VHDAITAKPARTSENLVMAKFADFAFHALG